MEGASADERRDLGAVGARRATLDIALQLVSRVANVALGVAVTIVLVRALGDTRFGQWSTIFAIVQIAGYLGDLGLQQIAVRKAAEEPEREALWIGSLLTLRLALAVPAVVITVGVGIALSTDAQMRVSTLVLALTILIAAVGAFSAAFQLRIRNALTAGIELANGVLWGGAVFLLAVLDAGMVPFAIAFALVALVTTCAQAVLALRAAPVHLRGTRDHWPELVRVGLPVAVSGLLIISYARLDQVLVFELDGQRGAGLYAAAYRVIDRAQLLPQTIMATLFPMLAAAHPSDPLRVRMLLQVALELLLGVALPVFAFCAVAAGPLVLLLFGPDFRGMETTLTILTGAYVLTAIGYLCGFVIVILALQKRFLRYAAAGLVINVGLNVALIPPFGYEAAAWSILVTQVVVIGLSLRAILTALAHRMELGRFARIVVAVAAMTACVGASRLAGAPIGVLMAAAAATYPLALLATRTVTRAELATLARRGA